MKTPMHTFKMDEEPWQQFVRKCQRRGVTAASMLRASVLMFLEDDDANANEIHRAALVYQCLTEVGRPPAVRGGTDGAPE